MSSQIAISDVLTAHEISDPDSSLSWLDGVANSSRKVTPGGFGVHGVQILAVHYLAPLYMMLLSSQVVRAQ